MIEREGNPDSDTFHDREARRIDRGKLVQVRAAKIILRLFQVAQLAREDPHGSRLADGILPRQRYIAVCTAIEEREGFDDDGNGGMSLAPAPCRMSHYSRAAEWSGSRTSASAIHAPLSIKTASPWRISARHGRRRARSTSASVRHPKSRRIHRLTASTRPSGWPRG